MKIRSRIRAFSGVTGGAPEKPAPQAREAERPRPPRAAGDLPGQDVAGRQDQYEPTPYDLGVSNDSEQSWGEYHQEHGRPWTAPCMTAGEAAADDYQAAEPAAEYPDVRAEADTHPNFAALPEDRPAQYPGGPAAAGVPWHEQATPENLLSDLPASRTDAAWQQEQRARYKALTAGERTRYLGDRAAEMAADPDRGWEIAARLILDGASSEDMHQVADTAEVWAASGTDLEAGR